MEGSYGRKGEERVGKEMRRGKRVKGSKDERDAVKKGEREMR